MLRNTAGFLQVLLVGAWLCSLVGCGDDGTKSPTALRMSGLANAYLAMSVQGGPPQDEESLKKHMRSMHPGDQYAYQIDGNNLDASFKSERDNEPLVVIYGQNVKISGESKQVIAHEKTGKNGRRLVVFGSTKVASVGESELEQLKSAKEPDNEKKK